MRGKINKERSGKNSYMNEAKEFLDALDTTSEKFTFQVFDDTKAKDRRKAKILHGTLEECWDALSTANKTGCGVFVTINETDGKGRETKNITRVRALFVDLDGSPLEPVKECELKPHIIVESSSGRYHAYWLVKDFPLDKFKEYQKLLIDKYGSDEKVHDLPRVMRLPGFLHCKNPEKPFRTRILEI